MTLRSALRRPAVAVPSAIALVVAVVWFVAVVRAAQPPTLDQRVRTVAGQLQVPGGFGDSAATSSLPVAQEMRDLIRQDLSQGMSERRILDYFRQRYGDSILETPPADDFNALMWLPPVALAAIAAYFIWRGLHSRRSAPSATASTSALSPTQPTPELAAFRDLLRREVAAQEGFDPIREARRS